NIGDASAAISSSKNAVENNYLSVNEAKRKAYLTWIKPNYLGEELTEDEKKELENLNKLDKERDQILQDNCSLGNISSSACKGLLQEAWEMQNEYEKEVARSLTNVDLYREDSKNLNEALVGLDPNSIIHLISIEAIAKETGRDVKDVAQQYKYVMAAHGIVSSLAGLYGGVNFTQPNTNIGKPGNIVNKVDDIAGKGNSVDTNKIKDNVATSQKGNESSNFGKYLTQEEQVFANKAQQELISEINKFKSNTQAEKVATMIGAFDPKTGKTAVGFSNKTITADSLHPTTVNYIEKQLGVKIGEFTSFCKNKAGACAEVSAADSLIRQGAKPENIKFTQAIRPKVYRQENGNMNSEKVIVETCNNCKVTWPKGTK
ncbi:DUF6862 domain-containing protein, partial [Gilliamella apicola]|uniref:DUF6862 domain-containing protein n=3 Tax=Gilliamella TaxID=1193503 RepID=UPI000A6D9D7A